MAAACACLVLAVAATPALAKKKNKKPAKLGPVTTVTATGNTANVSGGLSTATATCAAGTVAIGGGFSTNAVNPGTFSIVIDDYRVGTQQWSVSAIFGSMVSVNGSINAVAYCRPSNRTINDVTGSGNTPAVSIAAGSATATCPSGQKLVAGGFQSTHTSSAVVIVQQNSSTQPGAWTVAGINNTSVSQTLTAHAYCMAGLKKTPKVLSATTSPTIGTFATANQTSPGCPPPKKSKKKGKKKKKQPPQRLSAGGYSSPLTTSFSGSIPLYEESDINGSGWFAKALNVGAPQPTSVTSQGICA